MKKITVPTDAELANLFAEGRQIDITHCYAIGDDGKSLLVSVGYVLPDGIYSNGVYSYRKGFFTLVSRWMTQTRSSPTPESEAPAAPLA